MANTARSDPRGTAHPGVPGALRAACLMWLVAIGAGAVETVIGAAGELAGNGFSAGLAANIAVRAVVYSGAAALVLFLYRRRPWARTALAVLLGCVGLATLLAPVASWFAAGGDAGAALAAADGADLAYYAVRGVHIAAVLGAMAAMFLPSSRAALRRR
ncbi:hypothetical protein [Nocardiopsis composta]|uniref:Uncharacterized protein n=1 Tax=Nocardiopsis composta TaxID=157465 RepID=A0A7W8VEN8_9ACTN|nr:hypothetical protein [Nocardiopsis composta]MBB5433691.1 hypothetical protein [Nocardiopsis composta]